MVVPPRYNPPMIARLSGTLAEKEAGRIILDVRGVGYEVWIPLSTYYELGEPGEPVSLAVHTHVKEDALSLYGFRTAREKQLFKLLIEISGIGPKLAVTILSGLPADELVEAVARGDLLRLNSIPGVGKKTAERIVLELKGKVAKLLAGSAPPPSGVAGALQNDVVSALVNLGYGRPVAERAVSRAASDGGADRFETLLKAALKKISGG